MTHKFPPAEWDPKKLRAFKNILLDSLSCKNERNVAHIMYNVWQSVNAPFFSDNTNM